MTELAAVMMMDNRSEAATVCHCACSSSVDTMVPMQPYRLSAQGSAMWQGQLLFTGCFGCACKSTSCLSRHGAEVCQTSSMVCVVQINRKYNNPHIIIQVFPSKLLEQGVLRAEEAATYLRYMTSLTQYKGRTNVHLLQLNADDMPFDNWCASHPSAAADANIAAQLTRFIKSRIKWISSTQSQ